MWNSMKSVQLSLICTKVVIFLVIVCAIIMPTRIARYIDLLPIEMSVLYPFMAILYLCCIPAMIALICLHMLLVNIKREEVFIRKNVKLLRIISWCCFLVAFIMAFAIYYYLLFGLMAVAVAFIGLILRVVKNVIEEAVRLKDENDFTI